MADVDIPVGTGNSSGVFDEHWMWPPLDILDSDEELIGVINFEEVYPGRMTTPKLYTVDNLLPGEVTLNITSEVDSDTTEEETYTTDATYLSTDNTSYGKSIQLTIPAHDSKDFYMYWRPPSTSLIGNRYWNLIFEHESSVYPLHEYYTTFTVLSNEDTDEEQIIQVLVTYEAGKMETDFSDIRFYEDGWILDSTIDYKVDSSYAVFLVRIPNLMAGLYHIITILGGNSSLEYWDGEAYDEGWTWIDKIQVVGDTDITPWSNVGGTGSFGMADVVTDANYGHNVMRLQNTNGYDIPIAEAVSEAVYGQWTMRFNFGVGNSNYTYFSYYPIHDGTNYYKIFIDTKNSPNTVKLFYNSTELDSATFTPGNTIHIMEIIRTTSGVFTVKIDGTEYLSATENTITECVKTRLELDSTNSTYARSAQVDYIHFVEDDGSTTPTISGLETWEETKFAYPILGKISYDVQNLPGITGQLRYGIRINGVLYE